MVITGFQLDGSTGALLVVRRSWGDRLRRSVRIDALNDDIVSVFAYLARTVVGIPLHWHNMIYQLVGHHVS